MKGDTVISVLYTAWCRSWVNYVWLHLHSSQKRVKTLLLLCGYWVLKLISRSVTRWLSRYRSWTRMLQLFPASNSYFMPIDKPGVVLKRFLEILWANSDHIETFAIICWCFYWANSEYWEVKSISCWGCIVFRHCEGKDSRETIRCTYQVKSALMKFSEGKDHDCVFSCQVYLCCTSLVFDIWLE